MTAMDNEQSSLDSASADLGSRWEMNESGITVKLYPSCNRCRSGFDDTALLIHPNPSTGLEAKFSMPFCAAAASTRNMPTALVVIPAASPTKSHLPSGLRVTRGICEH